ncbi:Periplasmic nitrate reductase [Candidatus Lokiarchaeum ossiferum]|uniref:Periplasmic nitrate reductase n=1 Tax=Candidatus Lokiarchaeum ossiferum TaxID=2951803 RepID=A0ABY6HX39_9ARCH|nr:Periplasmic nitrate reductase [Candidatus Lokiarchaeum sp. B-35]
MENQSLIIDGKEIEFFKGETILMAAERAGIYIPRLCYIDGMTPYGGCRLCIVKLVGDLRPIQPSCSTPAKAGMNIITIDEELQRMRKDIIQLMISEHPNTCLVCGHKTVCEDYQTQFKKNPEKRVFGCYNCSQKNKCELREIIDYIGASDLTQEFEYKNYEIENLDPFFERHYNLCIVCGKCVRVCGELRGINAIDFFGRGHDLRISTPMNMLHIETNCQFCGACVDICPTGVLVPLMQTWTRTREIFTKSICGHCSIGCGLNYYMENEELVETIPNKSAKINKGQACVFGRFCIPVFNRRNETQFHTPLIRSDNILKPVMYNEAYSTCITMLRKYSPDEIAVLASPDLSNESAFILNQFASKVLKTSNIATICDNNCLENFQLLTAIPRSLDHIPKSDWILLVDANPQVSHPLILIDIKKAKDLNKTIVSLKHSPLKIAPETKWLLDEELLLSEDSLISKLSEFQEGIGSILVGPQTTSNIFISLINLCLKNPNINLIPLRSRANLDGVFQFIPQTEDLVYNAIKEKKIKVLLTTERISPTLAKYVENIILLDIFPSDFSNKANIIFPVTTFPESSGTLTNIEFDNQRFYASVTPFRDAKPDWQIICELAQQMKTEGFNYTNVQDIMENLPMIPSVQITDLNLLLLKKMSLQYGKPISWDDFVYRGEKISNRVPDLKKIIEYRKTKNPELIAGVLTASQDETTGLIEIEIDGKGMVKVGTQFFGLDSIKSIIKIAHLSNYRLKIIVDASNPNFRYVDRHKFCMCNNYKANLNESHILIDFAPSLCDMYLRIPQEGDEILKSVDGLIMVDSRYTNITEEEYHEFVQIGDSKTKMQERALHRAHQLLKDESIYYSLNHIQTQEKSMLRPTWGVWNKKVPEYKETTSSIIQQTQKVVLVDQDLCMGCRTCEKYCKHEAISYVLINQDVGIFKGKEMQKATIDGTKCYNCSKCISHCPVNAIYIREWPVEETSLK